jgi:hypothetical protein
MNRGIATGLLLLVLVEIQKANFSDWRMESVLCFCAALAAYRMHFYRIEYAGELFRQFIHSPLDIPKEPEAKDQDEWEDRFSALTVRVDRIATKERKADFGKPLSAKERKEVPSEQEAKD